MSKRKSRFDVDKGFDPDDFVSRMTEHPQRTKAVTAKDDYMGRVLAEVKCKMPLPHEQGKFNIRRWVSDKTAMGFMFDQLAVGWSLNQFCEEVMLSASAYRQITKYLRELSEGDYWYETYEAARVARAVHFAERLLDICRQVEDGTLSPAAGQMMSKNLQWLAERVDSEAWQQRTKVDQKVTLDASESHLEAVRRLAEMVKNAPDADVKVIDGEIIRGAETEKQRALKEYESLLD